MSNSKKVILHANKDENGKCVFRRAFKGDGDDRVWYYNGKFAGADEHGGLLIFQVAKDVLTKEEYIKFRNDFGLIINKMADNRMEFMSLYISDFKQ